MKTFPIAEKKTMRRTLAKCHVNSVETASIAEVRPLEAMLFQQRANWTTTFWLTSAGVNLIGAQCRL